MDINSLVDKVTEGNKALSQIDSFFRETYPVLFEKLDAPEFLRTIGLLNYSAINMLDKKSNPAVIQALGRNWNNTLKIDKNGFRYDGSKAPITYYNVTRFDANKLMVDQNGVRISRDILMRNIALVPKEIDTYLGFVQRFINLRNFSYGIWPQGYVSLNICGDQWKRLEADPLRGLSSFFSNPERNHFKCVPLGTTSDGREIQMTVDHEDVFLYDSKDRYGSLQTLILMCLGPETKDEVVKTFRENLNKVDLILETFCKSKTHLKQEIKKLTSDMESYTAVLRLKEDMKAKN